MKKKRRLFFWITSILLSILLLFSFIFRNTIKETLAIIKYANLFSPKKIVENFQHMYTRYPSVMVEASENVYELPRGNLELPEKFTHQGETQFFQNWIEQTGTTGFLIMHQGVIILEQYYQGSTENSRFISMSVSKSIVSFLMGTCLDEGTIHSLSDPVDQYAPALKGSGYEGVSIKDVLQMSSGIRFTEEYGDLQSDIVRMIASFTTGSLNNFVSNLPSERLAGTYNKYISADTQVLAMVIVSATGKSLTELTRERLWKPIGTEQDGYWLTDQEGTELAFGGFNACLRDYARFGQLYLKNGYNFKGNNLVSEKWVDASINYEEPHLQPGKNNPLSEWPLGYGYHWWIPEEPQGDFFALGIYGQFIYIHPASELVIVKTSAYVDYNNSGFDMEYKTIEIFQILAEYINSLDEI